MTLPAKQAEKTRISYWQFSRLIFVMFSLYLLGDAFYRWDGFSKYASFSEFLPSVSLAYILWSIVAISASILIWLPLKTFIWFCCRIGLRIRIEHLLLYAGIFILSGILVWKGKTLFWSAAQTTLQIKLIVLLSVSLVSIFPVWLFREKTGRWINLIQERITPLVWLFGAFVIISIPLVAYHTFWKQENNTISQKAIPPSAAVEKRPNIILVIFDTLTARDMSLYGYQRPTTPFIKKWAEEASVFTRFEAESNYTTPTTASFMTGKRVWTHRTYHVGGSKPVNSSKESLPAVLKNNGYYNMAFVVNPVASAKSLGIDGSFDIVPNADNFINPSSLLGRIDKMLYRFFGDKIRFYDWILKEDFLLSRPLKKLSGDITKTEVPPEEAFNMFLKILEKKIPEPYFAWIHVYPPHEPYLPPEPFKGLFNSSEKLRTNESQDEILLESNKYLFQNQPFPKEIRSGVKLLRNYYDEFIRYCDKQFENFISKLEEGDNLKKTIVILSSDHGESFEHDYFSHGGPHLYEQVTHLPLIIKEPGQGGHIIHDLVEQIDLPATILDLAQLPVPDWIEGRSLVPLINGENLEPLPAFSMNLDHNSSRGQESLITKGTIAVWEGDYKLIHYLEEKKSLLFNLRKDPDELINLFESETEVGDHLLKLIQENLRKANKNQAGEETG